MKKNRIIIADDHPVVLAGLRMLLNHNESLGLVQAEATNVDCLMNQLEKNPCDILITDYCMPDSNLPDGLDMLSSIRIMYPSLKIIVLTQIQNIGTLKVLKQQCNAIIPKQSLMVDLKQAIKAVNNNRDYLSLTIKKLLSDKGLTKDLKPKILSPRESEVVRLFCSGMSVSQIANKLNKSIKTVSSQKHNAKQKLGITTDAELFSYSRDLY
ncbi:response regulator transcription factor [Shewanella algae]|uniref:response regulator transcription factor n=1 Tax=Shewanella algae TaxID=38313 RepID=UPI0031F4DE09